MPAMPTFNELVNGFANKQTYERIQGVVHAGLEDIHNHAVRIQALQSKPGMEGLVAIAFPRLTKLMEEIKNEDRKKARTSAGNSTPAPQNDGGGPTPPEYASPNKARGGVLADTSKVTSADLHRYTNWNV